MPASRRFVDSILAKIHTSSVLGIRAGTAPHRVIGIWAVVVDGRVFVRSWSLSPRGWYRAFLAGPHGDIHIADRRIPVRAVPTKSERVRDAVDRAYLAKYHTPGSLKYARDLGRAKSRATTLELMPASRVGSRAARP
jgi:hypothetical protein